MTRSGSCLCGAVLVTADLPSREFMACHCTQCQRWTGGGPYYAIEVKNLKIEGEDNIRTYRASDWGERANCATCGSVLFWRLQGKPVWGVAVGLFDDQSGLTLTKEIFVDTRAAWAPPHAGAKQTTEAQEMAALKAGNPS